MNVPPEARAGFAALAEGFADRHRTACANTGAIRHGLAVADWTADLEIAGQPLADVLLPAFRHLLEPPSGAPDLAITAWDSATSGIHPVHPDWSTVTLGTRGLMREILSHTQRGQYDWGTRGVHLFDRNPPEGPPSAQYWVPDAGALPYWERSFPFRQLLCWFTQGTGRHPVHAAAVEWQGRSVLLPAASGSGKSTTSLIAALAGCGFLGDDYVMLDGAGKTPHVWSLYGTAKLDDSSLALLPQMAAHAGRVEPKDEKTVLLWPGPEALAGAGGLTRGAPLAAIVVPKVSKGPTRLSPGTPGDALMAMVPSTRSHLDTDDQAFMSLASAIVRQVPVYRLALGRDLERIPEAIKHAATAHPA